MSTLNVGAMAARLGLDPSEFLEKMKGVEGFASASGQRIANEMKRTNREGAESFRLIDEALGVHLSRPVTRILTQEFPGLAKGLSSILGAGVTGAVAIAAFEAVSKAVETLTKKFEEAKKAQEEYEAAGRQLSETLQDLEISHQKRLLQFDAELAQLSGNKGGELKDKIKIASIEDADRAIQEINKAADALERVAKAALEAESTSHRFWLAAGNANKSEHNLSINKQSKDFADFKEQLQEAAKEDATAGTQKGLDLAKQKAAELHKQLADAEKNRINDFRAFLDDYVKAWSFVPIHGGKTDKEISQLRFQSKEADQDVNVLNQAAEEHKKHTEVLQRESATTPDIGDKQISKLKAETEAELLLAGAVDKTTGAQFLQKAAGEAGQITARVQEEAHGKLTAAMQKELLAVNALTVERDLAKDITAVSGEMQKQTEEIQRNIVSAEEMASAYLKGGQAIEDAKIDQRLAPEIQKLNDVREKYEAARKAADDYAAARERLGKAAGPLPGIDIPSANLDQLKKALDHQQEVVNRQKLDLHTADLASYQEEINKTADALRGEKPYLEALNDSYIRGAEAVRKAQIALALYHWEQAHPGQSVQEANATLASPDSTAAQRDAAQTRLNQIAQVGVQLNQQSIDQQRSADSRAAAEYSVSRAYDDELQKLQRIREVLQQNGESTIRIDAAIYDAQERNIKQWDDAAFKVGKFGDKFQAVMNEVALRGEQASQRMAQAWLSSIDQVNDELAKLATGQKVDFKHIIVSLAQAQTKSELEKAEGWIAQQFGLKIPGLEGKPDGSQSKPLHVVLGSGEDKSSEHSLLGDTAKAAEPFLKQAASAIAPPDSGMSHFFSKIGNLFHSHKDKQGKDHQAMPVEVMNPVIIANWPMGAQSAGGAMPAANLFSGFTSPFSSGHPSGGAAGAGALTGMPNPAYSAFLAKQLGIEGPINWSDPFKNVDDLDRELAAASNNPFGKDAPFGAPRPIGAPNIFNSSTDAGFSFPDTGIGAGADPMQHTDLFGSIGIGDAGDLGGSNDFSGFGGFLAKGGDVKSGTTYVVGEKGPELFTSATSGRVLPNSEAFTFDPKAKYAQDYERYERWLHRGETGSGGLFSSLLALGGEELFKKFHIGDKLAGLFHHGDPLGPIAASMPSQNGSLADLDKLTAGIQIPDFAGFRAEGGDVMAGMNYLVGERGPELLRIPAMGSIVANHDLKNIGGSTDNSRSTNVTQNFNGPKDSDGFRRSVRQENARMLRHFSR